MDDKIIDWDDDWQWLMIEMILQMIDICKSRKCQKQPIGDDLNVY